MKLNGFVNFSVWIPGREIMGVEDLEGSMTIHWQCGQECRGSDRCLKLFGYETAWAISKFQI